MTIIVLYILLGIIAFIVILLHFSVRASIKASKQGVDIQVKWLFFTLYPRKPKKPKKPKKKKGEPDVPLEQTEQQTEQPDLSENGLEKFIQEAEQAQQELSGEQSDEQPQTEQTEHKAEPAQAETAKEKKKKAKKEKHKAEHEPAKEEKGEKKGKLAQLKDKYRAIKPYIPTGWKYFKKVLKKIRITNVDADVTVGKEDACEAAIWYGKVQGILFGLFGLLSCIFTVKLKRVDVHCKFNEKITDGEISLKVKVRPSTMIHIVFCLGINMLRIWLRQRRERKRRIKAIRQKREQARKQQQMNNINIQKG